MSGHAAAPGSITQERAMLTMKILDSVPRRANPRRIFSALLTLPALMFAPVVSLTPTAIAQTQPGEWTWVGGSETILPGLTQVSPGIYGTLGTASANNVPGGRFSEAGWTDRNGDFWLFGGLGYDSTNIGGFLNDLWKYDPVAKEWTWESGSSTVGMYYGQPGVYGKLGVASQSNVPGGRDAANCGTDSSGNLWLFGGNGYDSAGNFGTLSDLWKFDPATSEWTWIAGSNTVASIDQSDVGQPGVYGKRGVASAKDAPGGRAYGTSWTDNNGNFWLLGGNGFDSAGNYGTLNDLWKFDPATGWWTWVSGSSTGGVVGVYGSLGVASAANVPGSRNGGGGWTDLSGNLWLFGGNGEDSVGGTGQLDDLWKFNTATSEWTWVGGSSTVPSLGAGEPGVYGALGVAAAANDPGGRSFPETWTDRDGRLWLFGGDGYDSTALYGFLNDLWKYDPAANEWTWMSGSTTVGPTGGQPGVYGTLGEASAANVPGGRDLAVGWIDNSGNLWLFGGYIPGAPVYGFLAHNYLNDLWEFPTGAVSLTPTVTVTPDSSRITTERPLRVRVTVVGNSSAAPTGSVVLTGGGYTSKAETLRCGRAGIRIPPRSLSAGSDTLTVTYTPDSASSAIYNSASGTALVKVTKIPKCHP
jgi:N-acetylneuraminic acid mutarotase